MAVVAEQRALALVDEQQLVAVAVARQLAHRLIELPDAHLEMRVVHHRLRGPGVALAGDQLVEVEGARPDGAVELDPVGRLVLVVELRRGAEEALLADLALVGALGQPDMGLARGGALDLAQQDPVLGHGFLLMPSARRDGSDRARSTRTGRGSCPRRSPRCRGAG